MSSLIEIEGGDKLGLNKLVKNTNKPKEAIKIIEHLIIPTF